MAKNDKYAKENLKMSIEKLQGEIGSIQCVQSHWLLALVG